MKTKFDYCLMELRKLAEAADSGEHPTEEPYKKKNPYVQGAKVLGASLAGFGLGHIAGAGAGKVIEHITKKKGGDPVALAHKIGPAVGTAAGIIYPMWRSREQKGINDAVQSARDENERRLPRK